MTESEAQVQIKSIPDKIWMQISKDDKEAIKMAYMALEKQIPKKLLSVKYVENSMYVKCPSCKLTTELYDGCIMEYCKNCGQAIDWSKYE